MMKVQVNPFVLVAGALAAPVAIATLGRVLFSPDPKVADQEAEARSAIGKFALLGLAGTAGLIYAQGRVQNDSAKSAALGGAIGTALMAGTLGAALAFAPPKVPAAVPGVAAEALPPSSVRDRWVSNIIGIPAVTTSEPR